MPIYYYRARYFAPAIGRFLSRDTLGSPLMMGDVTEPSRSAELTQGPNLYWYVQDNPANKVDPSGLAGAGQTCTSNVKLTAVTNCNVTNLKLSGWTCGIVSSAAASYGVHTSSSAAGSQACAALKSKLPLSVPDQTCSRCTCKNMVSFTPNQAQTFNISTTQVGCTITATVSGNFTGTGKIGTCG